MGGYIKRDVERVEQKPLNTQIPRDIFNDFKDYCKYLGYPMNVVLETFMQQYANGRFIIAHDDIIRWKDEECETDTLNTTFSKEIHEAFKRRCKENGYFLKHVLMAFIELFFKRNLVMEYVNREAILIQVNNSVRSDNPEEIFEVPKGYMRCPFCGRYVEALSDNWCIIQPVGEANRYIACKECEGDEGEYKY